MVKEIIKSFKKEPEKWNFTEITLNCYKNDSDPKILSIYIYSGWLFYSIKVPFNYRFSLIEKLLLAREIKKLKEKKLREMFQQ